MAALDDDSLVDAFIAAARDADATDRVSVRNRLITKHTKLWKDLDSRGEAVRPRLLSYLSSPDPAERFGACVYTYTFAPEESFRVWEELIRNDYGEVSNWAFIQLDLMRRDGRAAGD